MPKNPAYTNNNQIISTIRWLLSAAILIHAIGLFATVFGMRQTHFGNYLFLVMGMPHSEALFYEHISVSIFFLLCVINLFHTRLYTLLPIAAYIFFEAWAGYYQGGYRYSDFTLMAHIMRYLTPLALVVLCAWPFRSTMKAAFRLKSAEWLLRVSLAILFFIHGLEAYYGYPGFLDLIIGSARNLAGIHIAESTSVVLLKGIGILDFVVALLVLVRPGKGVLFWALFWGTLTAFSRVTAIGTAAYIEVLFRASHMIAPLALWIIVYKPIYSFQSKRDRPFINRISVPQKTAKI